MLVRLAMTTTNVAKFRSAEIDPDPVRVLAYPNKWRRKESHRTAFIA